jgi:hypothetical protein
MEEVAIKKEYSVETNKKEKNTTQLFFDTRKIQHFITGNRAITI